MALRYAVDTNVLLRLTQRNHPLHSVITTALHRLVGRDVELCFTPQNLGEFWAIHVPHCCASRRGTTLSSASLGRIASLSYLLG